MPVSMTELTASVACPVIHPSSLPSAENEVMPSSPVLPGASRAGVVQYRVVVPVMTLIASRWPFPGDRPV